MATTHFLWGHSHKNRDFTADDCSAPDQEIYVIIATYYQVVFYDDVQIGYMHGMFCAVQDSDSARNGIKSVGTEREAPC